MAADGPVAAALATGAGRRPPVALDRPGRPVIRRRPEPTYLDGLSASRRSKLRRLRPRLAAAANGGEVTCVDLVDPGADLDEAVESFLGLGLRLD